MKRGPGPKRTTPLRTDPAKARAFADRARQAAKARPQKQRGKLAPRQGPAPVRFKAKRPAGDFQCAKCPRRATSWHHLLAQQHIRSYAITLRLPDAEERAVLRVLLPDERNLLPMCDTCHMAEEHSPRVVLTAADVPPAAHAFAAELGPEWAERLRRTYP